MALEDCAFTSRPESLSLPVVEKGEGLVEEVTEVTASIGVFDVSEDLGHVVTTDTAQPSVNRSWKSKLAERQANAASEEYVKKLPRRRKTQRYVEKNGRCNVSHGNMRETYRYLTDIFTTLVDLNWRCSLFVFVMAYAITWLFFGAIWYLIAYLRQRPPLVTATVSSLTSVGCMFVKISQPNKRAETLVFSKNAVISLRDDRLCLMFRVGDLRSSHIVSLSLWTRQTSVWVLRLGTTVFSWCLHWSSPTRSTAAHPSGTCMTCQARSSYLADEVQWGHRFSPMMSLAEGFFDIDYGAFHQTFEVDTPSCSAHELSLAAARLEAHLYWSISSKLDEEKWEGSSLTNQSGKQLDNGKGGVVGPVSFIVGEITGIEEQTGPGELNGSVTTDQSESEA
ncbi:unnamed protein product [Coregonus sp. 'balchen']|nr:unnamed protein product [Coregonus sp. 'balchen']